MVKAFDDSRNSARAAKLQIPRENIIALYLVVEYKMKRSLDFEYYVINRYLFVMTKEGKMKRGRAKISLKPVTSFLHSLTISDTWEIANQKRE